MTDWTQCSHYYCIVCREACINHLEDRCTQQRECRECHRIPDLQATPTIAGEGEGGEARLRSSATGEEVAPEGPEGATAPTGRKRGRPNDYHPKHAPPSVASRTRSESHAPADAETGGDLP